MCTSAVTTCPEFYASLATEYDISDTGQRREQKPGCCRDEG